MKARNIKISFSDAIELYNSGNERLKMLALNAFTEKELSHRFIRIQTLQDACMALNLDTTDIIRKANDIAKVSKASAAMFKLNIIRKALNLGYDLHLTKDNGDYGIYHPHNPFLVEDSTYFESDIDSGKMEIIGKIFSDGMPYNVLSGWAGRNGGNGLGSFQYCDGVGHPEADNGFLGCATREIAEHFGKYFGMLIIEAMYGDLPGFTIIEEKYHHL